jgi:LEA14-like dessication related protein
VLAPPYAGAVRLRLISLLLLLAVGGCNQLFEKPRVSVQRVDVNRVSFSGLEVTLVFAVENPNVIGLDLASLGYQLTVDGHQLVQGAGQHTLHVPANGTGQLQLPISIKFVELAEALQALFTKRQVPYTIATQLGFGTPIGVITVPISHAGTFPVPQLPTIVLGNASVGSASLEGANLSLTLQIHNSNAFPIPVGSLRYAVAINGVTLIDANTPPQQLGANATLPLTLGAHLDYLRAGFGIVRAIQSRSATVSLDGSFDLIGFTMPVHLQTTLR